MAGDCRTLVIGDGDVVSLLACAAAAEDRIVLGLFPTRRTAEQPAESPSAAVWLPQAGAEPWGERMAAARRQADLYGLAVFEDAGAVPDGDSAGGPLEAGEAATRRLIGVAYGAAKRGIERVVWPVSLGAGGDAKAEMVRLAVTTDRTLLVSRLVGLDQSLVGEFRTEVIAPYADLTDRQVADLVLDMDLPVWTCWWWAGRASADAGSPARRAAARWLPVLESVGWTAGREAGGAAGPPMVTVPRRTGPVRT